MDEDNWITLLEGIVAVGPYTSAHDMVCFYCHSRADAPHESTCLWSRSRAYLRENGVEVESED